MMIEKILNKISRWDKSCSLTRSSKSLESTPQNGIPAVFRCRDFVPQHKWSGLTQFLLLLLE